MTNDQQRYLLAIAIGPVQDFIAASRKARDLWAGSELLSSLALDVAAFLRSQDAELIFPAGRSVDDKHAVANKLLVITSEPEALAHAARTHLVDQLRARWTTTKSRLDAKYRIDVGDDLHSDLIDAQLGEFLEWYAAWTLWTEATHATAREDGELLLAGRKTLRDFWHATGRDLQPKSSLDPSRESVIRQDRLDRPVRQRFRLKGAEQLDAISLIKRLDESSRFVSTSRVAIDPLIRDLQRNDATALAQLNGHAAALQASELVEPLKTRSAAGKTLTQFDAFPYDSQLFYAASKQHAKALIDADSQRDEQRAAGWQASANDFLDALSATRGRRTIGELPAYYAVLRADGDRMGAALGELSSKTQHQDFSERLGTFAETARATVAGHFGGLIYSGGDDVLAFVPLDTAIPCANALRHDFATVMDGALPDGVDRPTLSVGIAIGHYAEHLQSILDRAGDAERAAKGPRDALAVAFGAHSGGGDRRLVVHRWGDEALERWAHAVELHRSGAFPDRGAYELDTLRREFADAGRAGAFSTDEQGNVLLQKEARRILARKRDQGGQIIREDIIDAMVERLANAAEGSPFHNLQTLVNELVIARRIASVLPNGVPGKPNAAIATWSLAGGAPLLADAANTQPPATDQPPTEDAQ